MAIRVLDMFCEMNSIMVPVLVDILFRLKAVNKKYEIVKE